MIGAVALGGLVHVQYRFRQHGRFRGAGTAVLERLGRGVAPGWPMAADGSSAGRSSNWQQAVDWWSQLMPGGQSQANDAVEPFQPAGTRLVRADAAGGGAIRRPRQQRRRRDPGLASRRSARAPTIRSRTCSRRCVARVRTDWTNGWNRRSPTWTASSSKPSGGSSFPLSASTASTRNAGRRCNSPSRNTSSAFRRVQCKLMMKCSQNAPSELFEDKLVAHEEPGRQLTSARALFDLWIDAVRAGLWREIALSEEFRERLAGPLTNAQMRLRARHPAGSRTDHRAVRHAHPHRDRFRAHRKIADLERALRRAAAGPRTAVRVAACKAGAVPLRQQSRLRQKHAAPKSAATTTLQAGSRCTQAGLGKPRRPRENLRPPAKWPRRVRLRCANRRQRRSLSPSSRRSRSKRTIGHRSRAKPAAKKALAKKKRVSSKRTAVGKPAASSR